MVDELGPGQDRQLADEIAATLTEAQTALPSAAPDSFTAIRRRYRRARQRRAALASAAVAILVLAITLAGVRLDRDPGRLTSPAVSPDGGTAETVRVWALTPPRRDSALHALVKRYNATAEVPVELTTFGNDTYKEKLRGVLDSAEAPDVLVTWGGDTLTQLARGGRLADLSPALAQDPRVGRTFLPRVLAGGAVDGRQYGVPMSGTQPVLLFYHKDLFTRAGVRPPTTYAELLSLVDRFKADGITPMALAGGQGWAELMYVMYLAERIGGPGTSADITAARPGAWSKPAVLQALRDAQELAQRGAFGDDFSTVGYDDGTASLRFATGQAAMHLMGSWEYGNQLGRYPEFVLDGRMGWVPFPTVQGGAGDPADVVGIPAQYFSVSSSSRHRDAAIEFVRSVASDAYLDTLIAGGEVPPVTDGLPRLKDSKDAPFNTFVYQLATRAPSYSLAWDQAVAPAVATALDANLQRLFRAELTPEEFAAAMEQTR
ncbi:extracellular solute-binding protein [Plantactinospora sp. CA-290183]|uniref:extracellular solute-binding protein n=1 Tax=Plantactinospora sp. CA-290183 TaxID=3240006 RepID=UPI003D8E2052